MDIYDYVNEATVSDVARKQKSITRLFPTFYNRVQKVAQKGGSHLKSMDEDTWKWKVHSGTKDDVWYDVVLHFKNIQPTVRKLAIDRRLWTKDKKHVDLNKLAKKFLQVADIQMECSCFTGDTKVPLLDGRILTMEEIFTEFGLDQEFWVYAADEKGDFVPATAKCMGVTGQASTLAVVTLDNGEVIKCTPDHLFMLRDGTYVPAKDLKDGTSLMPLYMHETKPVNDLSQSYRRVKLNSKVDKLGRGIWKSVHRIVAELLLKAEMLFKEKELIESNKEKRLIVHHLDCNGLNNAPNNLKWMGLNEHIKMHQKWFELFKEASKRYMQSDEGREYFRNVTTQTWKDLDIRKKRQNGIVKSLRASKDGRKRMSERISKSWNSGALNRKKASDNAKIRAKDMITEKNPMSKQDNRLLVCIAKIIKNCFHVMEKGLPVTEINYMLVANERSNIPKNIYYYFPDFDYVKWAFSKALNKSFDGTYKGLWPEDKQKILDVVRSNIEKTDDRICPVCGEVFIVHPTSDQILCSKKCRANNVAYCHNHKVISVEIVNLEEAIPVYDLTVEKYHNFALNAGVYVHNCPAATYWGPNYILSKPERDAKYGEKEDRPPDIRNPKQYGCFCKHLEAMFKVLPFNYWSTAARWLKKYHSETIANAEQFAMKQSGMFQKAGDELSKRKEDTELKKVSMKPQEPQKPPVEPPEPPEDEEGPEQPEEEPKKPTEPPEASEAPSTENEEEAGGNEDTDIPPNEDQPPEEQEAPLPNKPPQGDEVNPTEEEENMPIGPLGSGGKHKLMKPPVRRIKGQRRREDVEDQSKLPAKDNPFGKDVTKRK